MDNGILYALWVIRIFSNTFWFNQSLGHFPAVYKLGSLRLLRRILYGICG